MARLQRAFGMWIATTTIAGLVTGCFTPSKERELRKDIFNLQTRLLRLEQQTKEKGDNLTSSDKSTKKNLAQLQVDIDRSTRDLQKVLGELDRLRVGVETGELPGSESQNSVKSTLDDLITRVAEIESMQAEVLDLLKKGNGSNSKTKSVTSLAALEKAFKEKRYRHVAEGANRVLRKLKTAKSKEKALYLYAESLYKLGRLREAALKYNDFIEKYGKSGQLAQAKMRMGDCFRHLGDQATAKLYYQELISEFPSSEQASTAKERLSELDEKGASRFNGYESGRLARKKGSKARSL